MWSFVDAIRQNLDEVAGLAANPQQHQQQSSNQEGGEQEQEYEEGEELTKLPCSHIYHDDCIGSWTQHHIRCPLCNYDLETARATAEEMV